MYTFVFRQIFYKNVDKKCILVLKYSYTRIRGEDMQGQYLIIGSAVVIALVIVIIILHFIKQFEMSIIEIKLKN